MNIGKPLGGIIPNVNYGNGAEKRSKGAGKGSPISTSVPQIEQRQVPELPTPAQPQLPDYVGDVIDVIATDIPAVGIPDIIIYRK